MDAALHSIRTGYPFGKERHEKTKVEGGRYDSKLFVNKRGAMKS